jgi:hypothetical protein
MLLSSADALAVGDSLATKAYLGATEIWSAEPFNPLTAISWYSAFWAEDPLWTPPADGAAVDSWRNGGTLGTAATQTGANRPVYRASNSVLGNKPCIEFDGTDDRLIITSGVSLAQDFSIVVITTLDNNVARAMVGFNSASTGRRFGASGLAVWILDAGTQLVTPGAPTINTPYMVRAYADGATSKIVRNGTTLVTGTANTGSMDQIIIGSGRTAPSTYAAPFDGKIAFVGIYDGDVETNPQWGAFETWCSRYSITVV